MTTHWSDAYLGQPYGDTGDGCALLCERVQAEVFGREIHIPTEARAAAAAAAPADFWPTLREHVERYIRPTDTPADGDLVLLRCLQRERHVGLYCELRTGPHILHSLSNAGQAVRHPVRRLRMHGMGVARYYAWRS